MTSILKWLVDALEDRCVFLREDLVRDCKEILDIESIDPEEPYDSETVEGKDELLKRLDQWQRDKEFLESLNLHIIFARHLRKCFRASGDCDLLDAWKDENVKLDGKALADELESVIRETLLVKAPSGTDAREKFQTELRLTPPTLEYFHDGLEKLIGYPSLNVDPMEAMKAEHERDTVPFCDKKNRRVDPRKEWNIVVRSGNFKIVEADCDPDFPIKGRHIMHDLEHYVRLADSNFKGANLDRAEITALRLWTGPMHLRYVGLIREHSNVEEDGRKTEKNAGRAFAIREGGYVNTLHAINSGITKLARVWKVPRDRKVYRGYHNLKMQELKRDQFGCMGGVESSFLATSEKLDVAVSYSGDGAFILEINVGQVNKGADIGWLSQFPHEKEILFNALSNVEFLGSPQLCFLPEKGTIKVYRVQISSNTRSRTLNEFVNLRKGLHSNMAEVLLTQANRMISDRAEASENQLIKDLCLKCKEHSGSIFERGENIKASKFNKGSRKYSRLVEEIIMFQKSSLTLVDLASNWLKEKSAHLDCMIALQQWQLDSLRAAFKDNQRPCVTKLTFEEREKVWETSIFDADCVELGQIHTRSTIVAVGKLLSLNPLMTALYLKADWATVDVWEDVFKQFQRREGRFTINEVELAQYAIPSLQRLEIRYAQGDMAKMMVLALQCHPLPLLTCLSLCNCPIGCAGAESLARSSECLRNLKYLGLRKCEIGDRGCAALARNLSALDQLKRLDLSHNVIENQALLLLASASTILMRLKFIDVRFNANELRPLQLGGSSRIRTNVLADLYFDSKVICVAWSPEGSKLAAAFYDRVIILDAKTRQEITQVSRQSFACLCVAWSPDGSKLVSGYGNPNYPSIPGTTIIWDAETGDEKSQLRGHTGGVFSVAWNPKGDRLASGSADHTVIIWDAVTKQPKYHLKGHTRPVTSVAWNPEGFKIVSGSGRSAGVLGEVIVWNAEDGSRIAELSHHTGCVTSVAWSPDASKFASGSGDSIIIWDAKTGEQKAQLKGHTALVLSVAWSSEGSMIASGSSDHTIILWDAVTGEQKAQLKGHSDTVHSVAWSPEGPMIASGSSDKTIIIWEAMIKEQKSELKGHTGWIRSVAWSPEGSKLASGSADKTIIVWDAETGEPKAQLKGLGLNDWVRAVVWSPEGSKLALGSSQSIFIWDAETGEQQNELTGHTAYVRSVVWSPWGAMIASGSEDTTIIIWDAVTGKQISHLRGHTGDVWSVAWSPDGSKMASGSYDNTVIIWDAATGEQKVQLRGHTNTVNSVAWNPKESKLASASDDKTIILWDTETGEQIIQLRGHTRQVRSVAWSPGGDQIASGGHDRSVIIWDAMSGEQVSIYIGHTDFVRSVAWNPQGDRLASGSGDKTVIIWDARSRQQLSKLGTQIM